MPLIFHYNHIGGLMMRILKTLLGCILLFSGASIVIAANMQCGTQIISDDQREGQTKAEIIRLCGEPESKEGNTWYYKQPDGATFRLHFSGAGELESIQEDVD